MTEHIQEQISAFIDDELSSEECAFLVRRLGSDASARAKLTRYAAIGSVLRAEPLVASSQLLRGRIHAALDGAATGSGKRPAVGRRASRRRWAYSLAGAGVAASVAVAALVGLRLVLGDPSSENPVQAGTGAPDVGASAPVSYVVPPATDAARVFSPPIRLTNYLVQHGHYTSTLQRTSVHSNVVGVAKQEPTTAEFEDSTPRER